MFIQDENKAISLYIIGYIGLIIVQMIVAFTLNIDWTIDKNVILFNSILNLVFYGSMYLLMIILFVPFWKNVLVQFKENKKQYLKDIALGFGALIAASILMNVIYTALGITDTSANQEQLNQLLEGGWFAQMSLVLFAVFLAPMVEEMVFRMAMFKHLMKFPNMKPWLIIVISSFIFGFIHVMGAFDLEQIFYYAGLGAVLGVMYYKSKNIIVPTVIHMLLNGFVTLSMFLLF